MKFKWTVEVEVDESWIADGFNLTRDRALQMISAVLPFADSKEYNAKIIEAPAKEKIEKAQS